MKIYADNESQIQYMYLYYGETEVDYGEGDPEFEAACAECNEVHHQLDIAEELLNSAGYEYWYDGWGKLIVTMDAYDNVLVPAMERGELDYPIESYESDENTSWYA